MLPEALSEIRALGYKVGLHTAGIYPERFKSALPFVDWVGFDLKAPLDERYDKITQIKNSAEAVRKSVEILLESGVTAQYRCTFHPLLLTEESLHELRSFLAAKGVTSQLVIQKFRSQGCQDVQLHEKVAVL
jgi:pyruvate formate lyase activating enzyme